MTKIVAPGDVVRSEYCLCGAACQSKSFHSYGTVCLVQGEIDLVGRRVSGSDKRAAQVKRRVAQHTGSIVTTALPEFVVQLVHPVGETCTQFEFHIGSCRTVEADHTSVIDNLESEILKVKAISSSLRQSILSDAFAGKLVPQDPAEEPASVLLERIAEERSGSPRRVDTRPVRKKKVKA